MNTQRLMLTWILGLGAFITLAAPVGAQPGNSENGILVEEWRYDMQWYSWGFFGSSPGIANLPDVNTVSGEPDTDLEIVTGSEEVGIVLPGGGYASGLWYCFD